MCDPPRAARRKRATHRAPIRGPGQAGGRRRVRSPRAPVRLDRRCPRADQRAEVRRIRPHPGADAGMARSHDPGRHVPPAGARASPPDLADDRAPRLRGRDVRRHHPRLRADVAPVRGRGSRASRETGGPSRRRDRERPAPTGRTGATARGRSDRRPGSHDQRLVVRPARWPRGPARSSGARPST